MLIVDYCAIVVIARGRARQGALKAAAYVESSPTDIKQLQPSRTIQWLHLYGSTLRLPVIESPPKPRVINTKTLPVSAPSSVALHQVLAHSSTTILLPLQWTSVRLATRSWSELSRTIRTHRPPTLRGMTFSGP
jgi:hypothetical protein